MMLPPFRAQGVQQAGNVGDHGGDLLALGQGLVEDRLVVHGSRLEIMLQDMVVIVHDLAQAFTEVIRFQQLAETQPTA